MGRTTNMLEPAAESPQGREGGSYETQITIHNADLIEVTGVPGGCQSVQFADSPRTSEGSTMKFGAGRTPGTRTTGRGEAGSTIRIRPPFISNVQEDVRPAIETTSAAEQRSTLRFR